MKIVLGFIGCLGGALLIVAAGLAFCALMWAVEWKVGEWLSGRIFG